MSIRSMVTIKLLSIDQVFIKRFFSHLLLDLDSSENMVTWSYSYERAWQNIALMKRVLHEMDLLMMAEV